MLLKMLSGVWARLWFRGRTRVAVRDKTLRVTGEVHAQVHEALLQEIRLFERGSWRRTTDRLRLDLAAAEAEVARLTSISSQPPIPSLDQMRDQMAAMQRQQQQPYFPHHLQGLGIGMAPYQATGGLAQCLGQNPSSAMMNASQALGLAGL
jgi:hypothetical protein